MHILKLSYPHPEPNMTEYLFGLGHQVAFYHSMMEASAVLEQFPQNFDVLLLDSVLGFYPVLDEKDFDRHDVGYNNGHAMRGGLAFYNKHQTTLDEHRIPVIFRSMSPLDRLEVAPELQVPLAGGRVIIEQTDVMSLTKTLDSLTKPADILLVSNAQATDRIRQPLVDKLNARVTHVETPHDGLAAFQQTKFDLAIITMGLPIDAADRAILDPSQGINVTEAGWLLFKTVQREMTGESIPPTILLHPYQPSSIKLLFPDLAARTEQGGLQLFSTAENWWDILPVVRHIQTQQTLNR